MLQKRQRLEEDGVFEVSDDHFEMYEATVYLTKKQYHAKIHIPVDIIRHLNIKHKDRIIVAIKKTETAENTTISDKEGDP